MNKFYVSIAFLVAAPIFAEEAVPAAVESATIVDSSNPEAKKEAKPVTWSDSVSYLAGLAKDADEIDSLKKAYVAALQAQNVAEKALANNKDEAKKIELTGNVDAAKNAVKASQEALKAKNVYGFKNNAYALWNKTVVSAASHPYIAAAAIFAATVALVKTIEALTSTSEEEEEFEF